jgi:hypothetical protein
MSSSGHPHVERQRGVVVKHRRDRRAVHVVDVEVVRLDADAVDETARSAG